jgi:TATA-box binding protein (TBP) (component of TFIID and TFIIIB)
MISTGTTNEPEAVHDLEYVKDVLIKRSFVKPIVLQPIIQNIVVVADLEQSVDLEGLAKKYRIIYEPEQFPGGILKIEEPYKATILVFASGKIVIAGLRGSCQVKPTIQRLMGITGSYK